MRGWDPDELLDRLDHITLARSRPAPSEPLATLVGVPGWLVEFAKEAESGSDRSRQTYGLVLLAIERGCTPEQVLGLAQLHAPSVEKYGERLSGEIFRIFEKSGERGRVGGCSGSVFRTRNRDSDPDCGQGTGHGQDTDQDRTGQ